MIRWEPIAEVQDDSGEEAGFREAEQKAEDTKADGAANKSSGDRDQAPGDHDAADPEARSDLVQDDGGGDFEGEVAGEEDARAEAEHPRRQANFVVHGEGGEAHVDAVEEGDEVEQHQEGNEAASDFANRALFEKAGSRRCGIAHTVSP